jgi:D-beta-D-heptose 7-phosphate kinase/D-beta-D-heptose 1-phosphate adenosyltransferase
VTGRAASEGLADRLDLLAGVRVLVVGDVMLDRFVTGTVDRVSPEGPVPVLRVAQERTALGGAGNVLRNLSALGAAGVLLAAAGDDAAGREVERLAAEQGAEGSRILSVAGRATTVKQRYLAGGQQLLRADRETTDALPEAAARALLEAARAALPGVRALVVSDYGKGTLAADALATLIEAARAAGRPVVVDPKGGDYLRYRGASLMTPNRAELETASGLGAVDDRAVVAACRALIERCGFDGILATRSEEGMTLVERDGAIRHFRAEAREVFDVTGAGDTVVALLGAALAAGIGPPDAARLANAAAGLVVGRLGTAVVRRDELRRALIAPGAKVVSLDGLLEIVADWRRARLVVGFTNGCFDLLHPGHLALLRQARAACDRLVVGLNGDASARRLKGEGRPLQDEATRAAVLSAISDVDQVVIFAQDTPIELIEALRPEVLIKGADYGLEQVVGADLVQGYGGRVLLAEILPGHSTSATIGRI